jgi:hypothetical protein
MYERVAISSGSWAIRLRKREFAGIRHPIGSPYGVLA